MGEPATCAAYRHLGGRRRASTSLPLLWRRMLWLRWPFTIRHVVSPPGQARAHTAPERPCGLLLALPFGSTRCLALADGLLHQPARVACTVCLQPGVRCDGALSLLLLVGG
jgi:hypothetical protein